MKFIRYAIYYVPPPNAQWVRFATSWLGWDMQTGRVVKHPRLPAVALELSKITQTAQKYGLHGTLKPPFRLAQGVDQGDLETACVNLCQTLSPFSLGVLRLTRLGRFLALCLPDNPRLSKLAAACVGDLDFLRAPSTPQEIARRNPDRLTPRQQVYLDKWGYPFVLDDFRFHITLTDRLSDPDLKMAHNALDKHLTPLLARQQSFTNIALTGQDTDGRFHLIRRFDLCAAKLA